MKVCTDCHRELPLERFPRTGGRGYRRSYCGQCYKIRKRSLCARGCGAVVSEKGRQCSACAHEGRRLPESEKKVRNRYIYQCRTEGCTELTAKKGARCKACFLSEPRTPRGPYQLSPETQEEQAERKARKLGDERKKMNRDNAARGLPLAVLQGDVYVRNNKCPGCHKAVISPGKCYQCATGRPRTIFRPGEREVAA